MAFYTTSTNATSVLTPDQLELLFVKPVLAAAIATDPRVTTVIRINSKNARLPRLDTDVTASFVAEGAEISPTDIAVSEVDVTPQKCAALSYFSTEMVQDSSPSIAALVGASMARNTALAMDAGFLTGSGTAPAPLGLSSLTTGAVGSGNVNITALGATPTNLDGFLTAFSNMRGVGAHPTAILISPADLATFQKLKTATSYNTPLLGESAADPLTSTIFGVPLIPVPNLAAGTMWAVDSSRIFTVIRRDVTVVQSSDVAFTSDRVVLKSTVRVNYGFVHPASIQKITIP